MTRLHTVLCQMVPGTLALSLVRPSRFLRRTVCKLGRNLFSPLSHGLYRLEKQVLSTTMSPSAESSIKIIHRNRHGILCLYVCAPVLNRYEGNRSELPLFPVFRGTEQWALSSRRCLYTWLSRWTPRTHSDVGIALVHQSLHLLWSFISSKQIKLPHSWHSFLLDCSNCWAKHSGLAFIILAQSVNNFSPV